MAGGAGRGGARRALGGRGGWGRTLGRLALALAPAAPAAAHAAEGAFPSARRRGRPGPRLGFLSGPEDRQRRGGRLCSTTTTTTIGSRGRGAGGGRGARGSNNNTDSPPPPPPPPPPLPPDLGDAGLLGGSGGRPSTVARRNVYDTEAGRGRAGVWKLAAMGGPEGQVRREAATGPSMPARVDLGGRTRRDVHAIFRGLLLLAVTHSLPCVSLGHSKLSCGAKALVPTLAKFPTRESTSRWARDSRTGSRPTRATCGGCSSASPPSPSRAAS